LALTFWSLLVVGVVVTVAMVQVVAVQVVIALLLELLVAVHQQSQL
jgi:hypothetical protein